MTGQEPRYRVLVVDDHAAVRHELSALLTEEGVAQCSEAPGRQEALELAQRERPDLALVDFSVGESEGLALLTELQALEVPVLVWSRREEPVHVKRALAAGARGYVAKREAPGDLVRAVRDVLRGWVLISPHAAEQLPY